MAARGVNPAYRWSKQLLDLMLAAAGLMVTAPVWIVAGAAILLTDGPPILFRGNRLGRGGVVFGMYKFRTMKVGADRTGPGVTGAGDDRTTRIGRVLRHWKIDELPQLINVLRGDMSFVGPRPEDPRYLPDYAPHQRAVLEIRPGITGPTQIAYRNEEQMLRGPNVEEEYRTRILPAKLEIDLAYMKTASLATDLKLIGATARRLFAKYPDR